MIFPPRLAEEAILDGVHGERLETLGQLNMSQIVLVVRVVLVYNGRGGFGSRVGG